MAPTFWTACAACRLLHEFDRQYVGYRLTCPSCRRTFRATEVPPPNTHKPEMQLVLVKTRANGRRDSSTDDDVSEPEMPVKRRAKGRRVSSTEDDDEVSEHSSQMAVPDSDFYDFDADRSEGCFKKAQVWALYGGEDGMPRHYGLVDTVTPGRQFRALIRWLELQPGGEEGKACGEYKVGKATTMHSVKVFSHLVTCERVAKEVYQVYPMKGSVWAFFQAAGEEPEYEYVVFLSRYSEPHGASFGYLDKVDGFTSIFTRRDIGSHAVHYLRKGDVRSISHRIPARNVSKDEASAPLPPGDCWELDTAALPAKLLMPPLKLLNSGGG